jgi:hypothetical protein
MTVWGRGSEPEISIISSRNVTHSTAKFDMYGLLGGGGAKHIAINCGIVANVVAYQKSVKPMEDVMVMLIQMTSLSIPKILHSWKKHMKTTCTRSVSRHTHHTGWRPWMLHSSHPRAYITPGKVWLSEGRSQGKLRHWFGKAYRRGATLHKAYDRSAD